MTISHWATACNKTLEYIRNNEPGFQNYLYVNYAAFSKLTTVIREERLLLHKKTGRPKSLTELQPMFPCYARAATIPILYQDYNYPYADSFLIYPVFSTWMLIWHTESQFFLVDWINFQLDNNNLIDLQLFYEPVPISITNLTKIQNELYNNRKYLAENPRLVN